LKSKRARKIVYLFADTRGYHSVFPRQYDFFFFTFAICAFFFLLAFHVDRLLCVINRIFIATLIIATYAARLGKWVWSVGLELGSFWASISCRLGRALSQFIKNTSSKCPLVVFNFKLFFLSFLYFFWEGVSLLIKKLTDMAVITMTMTQVGELLCCDELLFALLYVHFHIAKVRCSGE